MHELYLIDIETFTTRLNAPDGVARVPDVLRYAIAGKPIFVGMACALLATLVMWLGGIHLLALARDTWPEQKVPKSLGPVLVLLMALSPTLGVLVGLDNARGLADRISPSEAARIKLEIERYMMATAVLFSMEALALAFATRRAGNRVERVASSVFGPIGFGAGALTIVAFSLAIVKWPTELPWALGTPALIFLFLASLAFLLVAFSRAYRATGFPVTAIVLVCGLAFSAFGWNDNHKVNYTVSKFEPASVEQGFLAWLKYRPDIDYYAKKGKPYPVYIVAAEGGGINAAYHVASFLARMQATCPNFAQHLFGISSVSGGSLGAAAFSSSIYKGQEGTTPVPADAVACNSQIVSAGPVVDGMTEFFRTDFLAPVMAATLFPDMLQRFLPVPISLLDRARGLERSFSDARAKFLTAGDGKNPFELSINELWRADKSAPALFLNTTSVEMGARITLGPLMMMTTPNALHISMLCSHQREIETTLAASVSLSARFPWLTPAGWLEKDANSNAECGEAPKTAQGLIRDKLFLVDGGYFENSGLETALEMAPRLRSLAAACRVEKSSGSHGGAIVTPSYCNNLPSTGVEIRTILVFTLDAYALQFMNSFADLSAKPPGDLFAPIRAMLNTRRARTRAIHITQSLFGDNYEYLGWASDYVLAQNHRYRMKDVPFLGVDDIHHVMLDGTKTFVPLGWRLSRRAIANIVQSETVPTKMTFELVRRELTGEDTSAIKRVPEPATR